MTTTTTTFFDHPQPLESHIHELALRATAGTLKKVYSGGKAEIRNGKMICNMGSSNNVIRQLRSGLQSDIHQLDNLASNINDATKLDINNNANSINYGLYVTTTNNKAAKTASDKMINDYCISDAYDLYIVAYSYLWEQIAVNQKSAAETITRTLKNGEDKTRTVFQWACVKVRKAIYSEKSIENNGKYIYIEDMKDANNNSTDALDREYIRLQKYYDIGGCCNSGDIPTGLDGIYTADNATNKNYNDMLTSLNLTKRQYMIIHYRMQGLSSVDIAYKLNVSQPAISKTLITIQQKITNMYPDMVRGFDNRISKKGRNDNKTNATYTSEYTTTIDTPKNLKPCRIDYSESIDFRSDCEYINNNPKKKRLDKDYLMLCYMAMIEHNAKLADQNAKTIMIYAVDQWLQVDKKEDAKTEDATSNLSFEDFKKTKAYKKFHTEYIYSNK